MNERKWTEAELQQIKGLGLPIKKTQRELELEQQVNTLQEQLNNASDFYKTERGFADKFQKERDALLVQVNTLTEELKRRPLFSIDELKTMQYWFSMAAKTNHITGFDWDEVDDSSLIKIQEALQSIKESNREEQTP